MVPKMFLSFKLSVGLSIELRAMTAPLSSQPSRAEQGDGISDAYMLRFLSGLYYGGDLVYISECRYCN